MPWSCWNPQQTQRTNLPVAPSSLAFTDCTPTEGLTLACPINDVQITIADLFVAPTTKPSLTYSTDSTTWGQARTHLQPGFLQISANITCFAGSVEVRYQQENSKRNWMTESTEYDSKYLRTVQRWKPQWWHWWHCWHCWTCSCCWRCLRCPTKYCNSTQMHVNTT